MRKIILAGNWKMNMLNSDLEPFFDSLNQAVDGGLHQVSEKIEMIIGVPATLMEKAAAIAGPKGVKVAAQNIHWEKSGAYTGELSAAMLKEVGVYTVIIGHSERRQYFGETDASVAKRVHTSLSEGMVVIGCVGETQKERETGETKKVVARQLKAILQESKGHENRLIIAYEPVWAIGTGLAATSQQAQDVHRFIRNEIATFSGDDASEKMRILYGGSMKPENTVELLSQPDIDGGLIGGSSLKPESYAKMINFGCAQY